MGSENQMEMMERGGGGNEAEVWAMVQAQVKRFVDLMVVVGGRCRWGSRQNRYGVATEVEASTEVRVNEVFWMYFGSGEGKRSREIEWSVG